MNEFKKIFNKTKLNAPVNGDDEIDAAVEVETEEVIPKQKNETNPIDYEKLESFNGTPKKDDKIAFQVIILF